MKHSTQEHKDTDFDEAALEDLIDGQAAEWFARLHADNLSHREQEEFEQWLNQDSAHRETYEALSSLWDSAAFTVVLTETAQKSPVVDAAEKFQRKPVFLPMAIAACLLWSVFYFDLPLLWQADYATGLGEQKTVHLEECSSVMLNTNTALSVSMSAEKRVIHLLKGEAYFEVAHEAGRPFIVQGEHSITRVTGTRFYVHKKSNSDEIKVTSGHVEVSEQHRFQNPVHLSAHDSVSVSALGYGETKQLDSELSTSWVDGYLVYKDASLASVIEQIQRYRHGIVIFKQPQLREFRINGRINLHKSGNMLEILQKTLPVKISNVTPWLVIIG